MRVRTRLVIVGLVLLVLSIVPAVGQSQADAANASYGRIHGVSAGGSSSGWVLFWVLACAGGLALVGAFVAGGKPQPAAESPDAASDDA